MKIVSWFSGGVTSTIATMLTLDEYGRDNVEIVFFETGSHHDDNARYFADCERLFGKPIKTVMKDGFTDIHAVFEKERFINSPYGAPCTKILKKKVRQEWEDENEWDHQVFGFEDSPREVTRAERFEKEYPYTKPLFPLIERGMNKEKCISILRDLGIELPMMYRLGYANNNCVGCVKGGMGYWNKIRLDFPTVFARMARTERDIGASCISGVFLDELDPERGRMSEPYVESCGLFCEMEATA